MGLWASVGIELSAELILVTYAVVNKRLRDFVPIDIDRSKERLDSLVLITMGETALSVVLTYREYNSEDTSAEDVYTNVQYNWILALSLLLIFMFNLMFFHMQPVEEDHAFRRDVFLGSIVQLLHKILGLALLTVGVCIKFTVTAVLNETDLSFEFYRYIGWSVGTALLVLLLIRLCHYGGREEIRFGKSMLRYGMDPVLDRIAHIWWSTFGCIWMLPFLGVHYRITTSGPVTALSAHVMLLVGLVVIETFFSNAVHHRFDRLQRNIGEHQILVN